MIKVLFFASLKERLGVGNVEVETSANCVDELLCHLMEQNPRWKLHLQQGTLLCAVNQELCDGEHSLAEGDEVAFFPPVTGG
ncbi:MAG: molybdopterin synthase sulfur carrier subunit [Gammaproteobacteria bacterium]|nr:molybdopterin synthase sulfur carrier subunit [Gammaproteobacteria bacterium]